MAKSKLQIALEDFHLATASLQNQYCGEGCDKKKNCEKYNICLEQVKRTELASRLYGSALHAIEELGGAVPEEQIHQYQSDIQRCIGIMIDLNQGHSGVWEFVRRMKLQQDFAKSLRTY